MAKNLKSTNNENSKSGKLREPNSDFVILSLKKTINSERYGLKFDCNGVCHNSDLMKLFKDLTDKRWSEVYSNRRNVNHGHERLLITQIQDKQSREYLQKYSIDKEKCDIFRFGNQKFRACGFREDNIFYLVCIDYDFSLYNHGDR